MARPRRLQPHPDNPECPAPYHGDENAYANPRPACRCPDARDAWRLYNKRRRQRRHSPTKVPAVGAIRRAQALSAAGHRSDEIAAEAGLPVSTVAELIQGLRTLVTRPTHRAMVRAFESLKGRNGSSRHAATRARLAGRPLPHEWLPDELDDPHADPHAGEPVDVDTVKVTRCVDGWLPLAQLNHLEQEAAVSRGRLEAAGKVLAERLGTSTRQIERVAERARLRAARHAERQVRAS